MSIRLVVVLVSLMLLATTTVMAGDAMAQSRDKAREPDRERVDRRSPPRDTQAHRPSAEPAHRSRGSDSHRALSDAVRRVERRTGGQVLSAERVPYDGRDVNRVKIVDSSGRVRVYVDDPPRATRQVVPSNRPAPPSTRPLSTRRGDN